MTILQHCLDCGELSDRNRCEQHRPVHAPKASSSSRGYDSSWSRLSRRARRIQPWCSHCGSTEDLTGDHSPEAWRRKQDGLSIRLADVDVLCRACNAAKGRARPTGVNPDDELGDPHGKAFFGTHTPGGIE